MLRILKWVYKLGQKHALDMILKDLRRMHQEHINRAEIADIKKVMSAEEKYPIYQTPIITAKQHQAIADAIYAYMGQLDPKSAPSIDWELEKMR